MSTALTQLPLLITLSAALLCGCGAGALASPPGRPDAPVAPAEPRARLSGVLELEASHRCEEKFDLALYAERAIELIQWDKQPGACSNRRVVIRYLRQRIPAERVAALARQHAVRFTVDAQGNLP